MNVKDYHKILEKVRIQLEQAPWRKVLTFSFCVLLAATFWFMEVYRQNFNATFSIPVKYTEIPDSVVFETSLPEEVTVTINDNGYSLFRYYFTKRKDTLEIDVSDVVRFSSSKILQGSSLEDIIRDELFPTSTLISYTPNRISFYYSPLLRKKIPVIFDGQVFLASGYLLNGDITVSPDSIVAYGSRDVLGDLYYAYTVSNTIHNLKSEEPLTYAIKDISNVRFVPGEVNVIVPVDKYTQKDITLPVIAVNVPEDLDVRFFPSSVKVSFLIGLSKYHSISDIDFAIQLDYNDLKNRTESFVPLRLAYAPDYVQNIVISPSEVEFIFEQK